MLRLLFYLAALTGVGVYSQDTSCPLYVYGILTDDVTHLVDKNIVDVCFEQKKVCLKFWSPSGIKAATQSVHAGPPCYHHFIITTSISATINVTITDLGTTSATRVTFDSDLESDQLGLASSGISINFPKPTLTPGEETTFNHTGCCSNCLVGDTKFFLPGDVISSDSKTCSQTICVKNEDNTTIGCPSGGRCIGKNTCVFNTTCTVTGPSIIDIHGQVGSIKDRCVHSLVSIPKVHVVGTFKDRRLPDVGFLETVSINNEAEEPGVWFHLEQDGKVWMDDLMLTLNSSVEHHGVEFSKDQTGVTATLSISNYILYIFFNGYTAQIVVEGSDFDILEGLCGNSSGPLSDSIVSELSATDCDRVYSDPAANGTSCNKAIERCNLLMDEPFTSCHHDVDQQPFITACTQTLCNYSPVDHLDCHFLQSYVRECSLRSSDILEEWKTATGCSSPEAFCWDKTCSDHEFCGEETAGGDNRCFCRTTFALKHSSPLALGEAEVCTEDSASVSLVGCLLEDRGIDYTTLHLNDPTCRGQLDKETHMVTFSFNTSRSCGSEVMENGSQIIYKNTITIQNSSSDIITRQDKFSIDFSCFHTQPEIKTSTFKIRDSSVVQQISSGVWNYTLTMTTYTDASHTQPLDPDTDVRLNQPLWVELKTQGLDENLVAVVINSCWATNEESSNGSQKYDLIINGCPNPEDRYVTMEGNGVGTSAYFSFNMFKFKEDDAAVVLHCDVNLCAREGNDCSPTCNGADRRRRSVGSSPSFQTSMSWYIG